MSQNTWHNLQKYNAYRRNPVICSKCHRIRSDEYANQECYFCEVPYGNYQSFNVHEVPEPPACDCKTCRNMCDRPCWPTPEEAQTLMDMGYADKLMLDYWTADSLMGGRLEILSPASPGYEGQDAPHWAFGCVFNQGGLCGLHGIAKPLEGRLAHHDLTPLGLHYELAVTWDSPEGRSAVERWRRLVGY